ncbi:MAG: peptide chain release factor N(5)-glutamine methyltransferase [Acidimicrobiales bacterium]|nr:peptide chain release factor N(5)-glutamine methyltransferase [Acidimicrobiales bacterium]
MTEAAGGQETVLADMLRRRLAGEPLAWITGFVSFAGVRVRVGRGVYVPRHQTELLARRAIDLLPARGLAADLCTGSGAVALALRQGRPFARVVGSDIDPTACECAAANGVEVYHGYLADPLPAELVGRADVVTAVVPYVPTDQMDYLPRDVREWEPRLALDGGPAGMAVLEPAVQAAASLLRVGGSVLFEVGGDQAERMAPLLGHTGFVAVSTWADEEGDVRGVRARLGAVGARIGA